MNHAKMEGSFLDHLEDLVEQTNGISEKANELVEVLEHQTPLIWGHVKVFVIYDVTSDSPEFSTAIANDYSQSPQNLKTTCACLVGSSNDCLFHRQSSPGKQKNCLDCKFIHFREAGNPRSSKRRRNSWKIGN
jgi:hypothetical protein